MMSRTKSDSIALGQELTKHKISY